MVYAQQNPDVIDAGVFHNDVIAVGNGNVLFCHQEAFLDQAQLIAQLQQKQGASFVAVIVPSAAVSVADAVGSYLFNSQLLTQADGSMMLLVPSECKNNARVWHYLQALTEAAATPIKKVLVMDLRESMRNGGGPACLRLRVELNPAEAAAVNSGVLLTSALYVTLSDWVKLHYRDRMAEADLRDPALLDESRTALDRLTQILQLGAVYPFQIA